MNPRKLKLPAKLLIALLIALQPSVQSWGASDFTTTDGKTFTKVKVLSEEPERIKISHSDGISYVRKALIPKEFLVENELTPVTADPALAAEDGLKAKLKAFAALNPTFTTKDERTFKSSEITGIEPNGLKLMTGTGIVRVRFIDLSERYKVAFGYDPMKAAQFEAEQAAALQESAEMRQKLANAASVADSTAMRVRLSLRQNLGKGWVCSAIILKTMDVNEVTSRAGSSLSGPAVIYESRTKAETVVLGEISRLMVFGLSLYQANTSSGVGAWEGTIYKMGQFVGKQANGDESTYPAVHTDRASAIRFIATAGGPNEYATSDGTWQVPEADAAPVVSSGNGTGFGISADGYIATAYHVVDKAMDIQVYVDGKAMKGSVVATDPANDLAILKVEAKTHALPVYSGNVLKLGQDLFTIGFPLAHLLGQTPKFTKGSVAGVEGMEGDDGKDVYQISVPIQGGNSGGPVALMDGRVVAVVRSTLSTLGAGLRSGGSVPQNVNFATRSNCLIALAKKVSGLALSNAAPEGDARDAVFESVYLIVVSSKN